MTSTAPAQRFAWLDLIKGISVILVVVFHTGLMLPALTGDNIAVDVWSSVNGALEPLRMPVFFTISGMLASRAALSDAVPWRQVIRARVTTPLYLYALWTGFMVLLTVAVWQHNLTGAASTFVRQVVTGAPGYWYLAALPVFFLVTRTTRHVPAVAVIALAALPNLVRPVTAGVFDFLLDPISPTAMMSSFAVNLCFYIAGARWREWGYQLANWGPRLGVTWILLLAGALLLLGTAREAVPFLSGQTLLLQSVGWICWAFPAARLVTTYFPEQKWASRLGAQSLAIYVCQFPILFLTGKLTPLITPISHTAWFAAALPLMVTAVTVLAAVATQRWLPLVLQLPQLPRPTTQNRWQAKRSPNTPEVVSP
jgi:uncharacterized membrane protein YcfT